VDAVVGQDVADARSSCSPAAIDANSPDSSPLLTAFTTGGFTGFPGLRMAAPGRSVAVRGMRRGSQTEPRWQRLHVPALHQSSQPVACASKATMAWKGSAGGLRTTSNTATTSLAALSVLVHSRTRRREQGFMRNFRGIRDEAAE
jgi:hypothetical protein